MSITFRSRLVVAVALALLLVMAGSAAAQREFHGVVEVMPPGYIGTWVISGRTVEVTPATEIKFRRGPISVGSWVKVHGFATEGGYVVREIELARKGKRRK